MGLILTEEEMKSLDLVRPWFSFHITEWCTKQYQAKSQAWLKHVSTPTPFPIPMPLLTATVSASTTASSSSLPLLRLPVTPSFSHLLAKEEEKEDQRQEEEEAEQSAEQSSNKQVIFFWIFGLVRPCWARSNLWDPNFPKDTTPNGHPFIKCGVSSCVKMVKNFDWIDSMLGLNCEKNYCAFAHDRDEQHCFHHQVTGECTYGRNCMYKHFQYKRVV